MIALLAPVLPKPLAAPRTTAAVGDELRTLLATGALELPLPAQGDTAGRWSELAAFGRRDLTLARLAEGHTDAVAILAEAGRSPAANALYGVWAAKSEGTGAELNGDRLSGTVRFCSGAGLLDRALVTAGDSLAEVDLAAGGVHRRRDAWQAIGMDASDSGDVVFEDVTIDRLIGEPGWYVGRPGFAHGGGGVAAVWLGGCAGVIDAVLSYLRERGHADDHQLAHLGAMHAALHAADALLTRSAAVLDDAPDDAWLVSGTCRAAVEKAACEILEHAPKLTGPTPLCRDQRFAQRLADLLVYVRQHHAERDLAGLGRLVLDAEAAR